jgi:hypothetical protein
MTNCAPVRALTDFSCRVVADDDSGNAKAASSGNTVLNAA